VIPEIVDGVPTDVGETLDSIAAFVRRFVVMSDAEGTAIALWVFHTHALDAADATPYVAISSAEPESGKTQLLEVLELLVHNPWFTSRVTAAVLTRRIDKEQPCLLLDESDAAFRGDREYSETLRGVLNAGYRRGGCISLCVGQGASIGYVTLSVFAPKAIAGLDALPDTVVSRSIPIRLKRKRTGEQAERFRRRSVSDSAEPIRDSTASLAAHHLDRLTYSHPLMPEGLRDRACDVWEPLLAIAELAGDTWTTRARQAAVELSGAAYSTDETLGIQLLTDIRLVMEGMNRISSAELVAGLNGLAESPWCEWSKGRGLVQRTLAIQLARFRIHSNSIRLDDGSNLKGYRRQQFEDDWDRYLPTRHVVTNGAVEPEPPDDQPSLPALGDGSNTHRTADKQSDVTDSTDVSPQEMAEVRRELGLGDDAYPALLVDAGNAGHITEAEFDNLYGLHKLVESNADSQA
jgi:hypothetical protein